MPEAKEASLGTGTHLRQTHPQGAGDGSEVRTFLIPKVCACAPFARVGGDEAPAQLASRFAEAVREPVTKLSGSVVEMRADDAVAVFASPGQTIGAAVEPHDGCLERTQAAADVPLPVGMGLHVAEALEVDGAYRGGAVNLARLLCAEAGNR